MLISNKLQKALLTASAMVLILLCYQAIKMLSANLSYYQTYQLQELWLKKNELTDVSQYQRALKAIDDSNNTHQDNPQYLITQGLVLEWAGISKLFTEEEKQQKLRQAKDYYLQSVALRPTWPVTWATLAILKWRLNEIDQSLIDYLKQADKYGANTLDVHHAWVDIGFYLYKSKSPYTVQIITGLRRHLKLMLKDERNTVRKSAIAMIERHHAQKQACNWLSTYSFDTTWHKAALCNPKNTKSTKSTKSTK